jgi:methylated-DNA-protein-cysteine methyltransferase-like protein
MSELYGEYPCHRVVNHTGRLAPHFYDQKERLLAEGVTFRSNGCVDMKKHRWDGQ